MTLLARLRSFMAALVKGRRVEQDMEDEWRFHVEARADDLAVSYTHLTLPTIYSV